MRNFLFALPALAAALALSSCNTDFREHDPTPKVIDSNTLAFTLKENGPETRSGSDVLTAVTGVTIPLGEPVGGYGLFLEETVTTLGTACMDPETKGTPVYTENFSEMFDGKFYGLAYSAPGGTLSETPAIPDGAFENDGDAWVRKFASDPFGDNDELYFFMRAPETMTGMGAPLYSLDDDGKTVVEFDYTVPLNAADQQDILFTGRPVTKSEAGEEIPVLFHHALTGVKFATDNDNSGGAKTYITKIEFPQALFRSAHIKVTSSLENGRRVDDPDTHSSSSTGVVVVDNPRQLSDDEVFTLELEESDIVDFEPGGKFENKGGYAGSFAAAGNESNLNDADATKTFWFIPQQMDADVVMDVTFHVVSGGKDSGPVTRRIEFGKALTNSVFWKAGEIRTYTLKAGLMDVDIEDRVSGFEKTDVVISNTGNIDSFIRAHIVANWYGNAGGDYGIALGYRSGTGSGFVPAWKMDDTLTGDNYGGVFTGLPGADWEYKDGFFYYTKRVPAGHSIPSALFSRYVLDTSQAGVPPDIYYLDRKAGKRPFTDLELVMEIPVQAVDARDYTDYRDAWGAAGVTIY